MDTPQLRIGEVAELLNMHVNTLRRLANAGVIPFQRTAGGQRLFQLQAVKSALEVRAVVALSKQGKKGAAAASSPTWQKDFALLGLEEHVVWQEILQELELDMSAPVADVMPYAFNEMLNNAIDHSEGTRVRVSFWADENSWAFELEDDGIGIFRKVQQGFGLETIFEAPQELTKGKRTTAPKGHSGEGIFFTSKSVDIFNINSNELCWVIDNLRNDQGLGQSDVAQGTKVFVKVAVNTDKTMKGIFEQFSVDHDFIRTRPSVKLLDIGVLFVSRSQAKRILEGLEPFVEIEIDFQGVSTVGQGFIDEIVRVFPSTHPGKKIIPINMNEVVEFMVNRVNGGTKD